MVHVLLQDLVRVTVEGKMDLKRRMKRRKREGE
jgi:hypothetical protein